MSQSVSTPDEFKCNHENYSGHCKKFSTLAIEGEYQDSIVRNEYRYGIVTDGLISIITHTN